MTNDDDKVTYRDLIKEIRRVEEISEQTYTKLIEFEPIKKVVYGMIALILTTVVLAILGLVLI